MSEKRDYTGKLTNPLPNVDPSADAADVYAEVHAYGPVAQAGGGAPPLFHEGHRWSIDAAAAAVHRQVRAVWEGDLYIAEVINPGETDPDKVLVSLALELLIPTPMLLPLKVAVEMLDRAPSVAFYGNVRHASLRGAMLALGYGTGDEADLLEAFLDLGAVGGPVATVLPVRAGDALGEVGEVALDGGGTAIALDFKLAMGRNGRDAVYPDGFYLNAETTVGSTLFLGELGTPAHERDPQRSVWSVCEPRVVVWCNDEWNEPLGLRRAADVTLTREDGATLTLAFPQLAPGEEPIGGFALADWAEGHTAAAVEARPLGEPAGDRLLLSGVPTDDAAAEFVGIALERPAEIIVQALDPTDWFPEQGGLGWDPKTRQHTPVQLVAPFAPARFTNGNRVTPLIDGTPYFADLVREMDRITGSGHFLCIAKWWVDHDFALTQVHDQSVFPPAEVGDDERMLIDHWQRISGVRAPIFAIMWNSTGGPIAELPDALPPGPVREFWIDIQDYDQPARQFATALLSAEVAAGAAYNPNADSVAALNGVGPGTAEAILDGRHRPGASHHAKMAVVRNTDGLVAWLGGIDINENRVNTTAHHDFEPGAAPYHDVHCRIEGPAARDVLRTFISRWNDHPALGFDPNGPWTPLPDAFNGKTGDLFCTPLGFGAGTHQLLLTDGDDREGGTDLVQIGRTFGNCGGLEGAQILNGGEFLDDSGYAFAPDGDFTIESAVLGAISQAQRFIYIEDQFLASMKIATAVADRIVERKAAYEADPQGEEPFYVYILVPYFPNSVKTATDLGMWVRAGDALKRFADWAMGIPGPSPSLAGKILELAEAQSGQPVPDRFEKVDSYGYTHTRWHNLLSSVDPGKTCWQMHCLRLPPYQTRQVDKVYGSQIALMPVPLDERRTYIHTKVTIVDDIWATIGSANMCVRSHTMDTEINCSFIDGRTDARGLRVSVRDLRREIWADHWGVKINLVPEGPGNDPEVIAAWKSKVSPAASRPDSGSGTLPFGSRVYEWPFDEVKLDRDDRPKFTWSRQDAPVEIEPYGLREVPLYWWFVEQFGKAPWDPVDDDLMPPPIGSDRFEVDGKDGSQYTGFDLAPHPD